MELSIQIDDTLIVSVTEFITCMIYLEHEDFSDFKGYFIILQIMRSF